MQLDVINSQRERTEAAKRHRTGANGREQNKPRDTERAPTGADGRSQETPNGRLRERPTINAPCGRELVGAPTPPSPRPSIRARSCIAGSVLRGSPMATRSVRSPNAHKEQYRTGARFPTRTPTGRGRGSTAPYHRTGAAYKEQMLTGARFPTRTPTGRGRGSTAPYKRTGAGEERRGAHRGRPVAAGKSAGAPIEVAPAPRGLRHNMS